MRFVVVVEGGRGEEEGAKADDARKRFQCYLPPFFRLCNSICFYRPIDYGRLGDAVVWVVLSGTTRVVVILSALSPRAAAAAADGLMGSVDFVFFSSPLCFSPSSCPAAAAATVVVIATPNADE